MAITEPFTFSATVSTTELSILSGTSSLQTNTTAGVYQLYVDFNAAAKGDEFRIKLYEKARSADTKRAFTQWSILGVQTELFVTPTFILMNGWDMTIIKLAGTDRTITASVRKVA